MLRHEERCTLNPNRKCGYCGMLDQEQPVMADLIALLPNPQEYEKKDDFGGKSYVGLGAAVDEALPMLRKACENCPACIFAALRQKGKPVFMTAGFDFKAECQSVWAEFNTEQREKSEAYY